MGLFSRMAAGAALGGFLGYGETGTGTGALGGAITGAAITGPGAWMVGSALGKYGGIAGLARRAMVGKTGMGGIRSWGAAEIAAKNMGRVGGTSINVGAGGAVGGGRRVASGMGGMVGSGGMRTGGGAGINNAIAYDAHVNARNAYNRAFSSVLNDPTTWRGELGRGADWLIGKNALAVNRWGGRAAMALGVASTAHIGASILNSNRPY